MNHAVMVGGECAWCMGNRELGEICACNAPELVDDLLGALKGLLEIEDARIGTGIFKPNAEAGRRIEAARAVVKTASDRQEVGKADAPKLSRR